jgi:RNA polymerase sigma-70 factor (ECF subfamily)
VHQRVLLTTWRRFDELPTDADEQLAWMIGVARRELANHRRSEGRRTAAVERLVELVERLPPAGDSMRPDVGALLSALDELDREIVTLTYWDRLTSDQVATVVGLSAAAVRKRLQRCRTTMRGSVGNATALR